MSEHPSLSSKAPYPVTIVTLFPELFPGVLGAGVVGRGLKNALWSLETLDIRNYSTHKHLSVDDTPFGGGAGMVLRPDVVDQALCAAWSCHQERNVSLTGSEHACTRPLDTAMVYLSPRGQSLKQDTVTNLASKTGGLILLCGRYEAVDERVLDLYRERCGLVEISIGDYVLSGGEVAAMVVVDAVVRRLPGVVGSSASLAEESFTSGLLEYPHYTRPANWNGDKVPDVLLSGHHGEIATWRQCAAEKVTQLRRPDLWAAYEANQNKCDEMPKLKGEVKGKR